MHRAVSRRVALVTIAIGSVMWGLFLVFRVATRDQINGLSTPHLLAILALLVLPGAAWLAWRVDCRASAAGAAAPEDPILPTRVLHSGPKREAGASHRRDTRPGRSRTTPPG